MAGVGSTGKIPNFLPIQALLRSFPKLQEKVCSGKITLGGAQIYLELTGKRKQHHNSTTGGKVSVRK